MVELTRQLHPDAAEAARGPSRTQRKQAMDRLKQLGREMVEMTAGKFAKLPLPDELRRAVELARRMDSLPARNREVQGLGRLLETIDEVELRAVIAAIDHGGIVAPVQEEKKAKEPTAQEVLAYQLIDGGDPAVFALSDRYARDDLQSLRQAVRLAKKQITAGAKRESAAKNVVSWLSRFS